MSCLLGWRCAAVTSGLSSSPPLAALLVNASQEAVAAAIDVAFVRLGDEEVGDGGEGGHGAAAEVAGEAAQPAGGPEAAAAAAAASEAFGRAVADSAHGAYEQLQAAGKGCVVCWVLNDALSP